MKSRLVLHYVKIKALAEEDKAAFLALLNFFWITSFSFIFGCQENFMICLRKKKKHALNI